MGDSDPSHHNGKIPSAKPTYVIFMSLKVNKPRCLVVCFIYLSNTKWAIHDHIFTFEMVCWPLATWKSHMCGYCGSDLSIVMWWLWVADHAWLVWLYFVSVFFLNFKHCIMCDWHSIANVQCPLSNCKISWREVFCSFILENKCSYYMNKRICVNTTLNLWLS